MTTRFTEQWTAYKRSGDMTATPVRLCSVRHIDGEVV